MSDSPVIPNELSACQTLIGELARTVEELSEVSRRKDQEIAELKLTVSELLQQAFRKRSERYLDDPDQLKLDFGDTDDAADAADGLAEAIEQAELIVGEHKRRKQSRPKRRNEQLPEHLPRYEVEADAAEDVKHCEQHGERKLIGYDRSETLEFERPKLKVRVTKIPKYACEGAPRCGVVEPPRQPGLVEGNRYDASVAAEIVTAKYGYHLPIYRQQDWFGGSGWMPGRSTLLNILQATAELIRPLVLFFRKDVLSDEVVGTDDTRVTLLLPNELPEPVPDDAKSQRIHEVFCKALEEGKPSISGRLWAYRGLTVPLNVFDFTVSRHRDGPDDVLVDGGFCGTLLADCYLRNHRDALRLYLSDGRLPFDNNEVEQLMKQVAIGRKNWLFVGSVAAGERAADLLTLVSSAVRNDLDVWAYVKDVLDRLLAGSTDYAALRPDRWAAAHPGSIRTYRKEERRDRADAKRARRADRRLNRAKSTRR